MRVLPKQAMKRSFAAAQEGCVFYLSCLRWTSALLCTLRVSMRLVPFGLKTTHTFAQSPDPAQPAFYPYFRSVPFGHQCAILCTNENQRF
ncbi:MAG: hypothetical protein ACPGWR_14935 [Ardenticatenaceae bacterium]